MDGWMDGWMMIEFDVRGRHTCSGRETTRREMRRNGAHEVRTRPEHEAVTETNMPGVNV